MILLWVPFALLLLALGTVLIARSSRRASHMACRKCGYDLRGTIDAPRCPECGNGLDGDGIRMAGESITVLWVYMIGLMLVSAGAIATLVAMWAMIAFMLRNA